MKASLKKLLFISLFGLLISFNACSGGGDGGGGSATPPATEFGGTTPPSSPPPPSGPGPLSPPPDSDGLSAIPGYTQGTSPVVALNSSGNAIVAWFENDAPGSGVAKVHCWRQSGTTWQHLGEGIRGASGIMEENSLNLAVGSDGNPVLAWVEQAGTGASTTSNVYIRRWDGSAWQPYGTPGFLSAVAETSQPTPVVHVSMELNPTTNNPVVAWRELYESSPGLYADYGVFASRWDGSAWQSMGAAPFEGIGFLLGINEGPNLAMQSTGNAVLTYPVFGSGGTGGIRVFAWDGMTWAPYMTSGPGYLRALGSDSRYANPATALDAANNPFVIWWEAPAFPSDPTAPIPPFNIYARQWDGSSFVPVGAESGKVTNITTSGTMRYSSTPIVDNTGRPLVVWGQADGIHIRRWNPSATPAAWQDISGTPLHVGAVSGTSFLEASNPAVAYDSAHNTITVVWSEFNGTARVIYVRRISL